ncbi:MAG: acetolactate synthase small subunit [Spirochaetes bacterium]|nr:acetolactate synthase small subunit [Spirochaetota bacterium]
MSTLLTSPNLHTLSVYVNNKPGVLVRVAHVFARRGFNIESLVVSPTADGRYSRMTVTADGDGETLEQIFKQVSKLVDVLHATEHTHQEVVEKELALIKVRVAEAQRTEVLQILAHFKGATVDFTPQSVIVQVTGNTEKIEACVGMLEKYGIIELVRTGKVIMARGETET